MAILVLFMRLFSLLLEHIIAMNSTPVKKHAALLMLGQSRLCSGVKFSPKSSLPALQLWLYVSGTRI